ncbi:MAG TPA: bifunctional 2-polyprenyl-6-hydroxyphenol methylase/3-demethylubiquinol 3-O-methyltransferase UbiG [Paracoccaceae bacterium]|nr:bifunctional 2-polyprenyl-6-hydroxyphenol methylase/3-demethylubiquinol 3-O-methyltransferase UbiG [Paracoccaceae bacterium]
MSGIERGAGTVDPREIARFNAMAARWWDPDGPLKPLHALNPCRLGYIVDQITAQHGRDPKARRALDGLRVLDIGCGGGLLTEPMARLGAEVMGADAGAENIAAAKAHARQTGLEIDYRVTTAEALAVAGEDFDVVLNMEVIEHVADPRGYLDACARLVRPGGLMLTSTINRTAKAWAMAVVGAERVLRWLPPGTHDWRKFVTPDELFAMLSRAGLTPVDRKGFVFDPLGWSWLVSETDLDVNYVTAAVRPG